MTAYMVAEMDVTDAEAYEAYKAAAGELITRYGGRYLSRGGPSAVLEGEAPKRVVIVVFDSIEAAQRWYRSDDYQAARRLRDGAAKARLFVVEGL
jgi:uncharacterized protein (DUF1330 family)